MPGVPPLIRPTKPPPSTPLAEAQGGSARWGERAPLKRVQTPLGPVGEDFGALRLPVLPVGFKQRLEQRLLLVVF